MAQLIENEALDAARQVLESSQLYALRQVHVQQHGDAILLSGKVDSYYLKQQAQELLREVASGLQLQNRIKVQRFETEDGLENGI
jgi:hypothetical protein